MSLNSAGANNANDINCGSDASIDDFTAFTIWAWVKDALFSGSGPRLFSKGDDIKEARVISAKNWRLIVGRATTNANASANIELPVGHSFVAMTYDESDGPRIFQGTLTAILTEVSYATRTVGSGATTADAANDLLWANRSGGEIRGFVGDIGLGGYINSRLTLGQLRQLQFRPRVVPGTKGFWIFGYNGTGVQADLSGNGNNGVVSGLTQVDHIPIGPPFGFNAGWQGISTIAAPGGASVIVLRRRYEGY